MPSIREARTKIIDKTYRDIEAGSEKRVELAAEATGAPASEMTSLKITNLSDSTREGDVAAMEARQAAANLTIGQSTPKFHGSNGAEYAANVNAGYMPRAGMSAQARIQKAFGR